MLVISRSQNALERKSVSLPPFYIYREAGAQSREGTCPGSPSGPGGRVRVSWVPVQSSPLSTRSHCLRITAAKLQCYQDSGWGTELGVGRPGFCSWLCCVALNGSLPCFVPQFPLPNHCLYLFSRQTLQGRSSLTVFVQHLAS